MTLPQRISPVIAPSRKDYQAEPELRVVLPSGSFDKQYRRTKRIITLSSIFLGLVLFAVVALHVVIVENQFHLYSLQKQANTAQAKVDNLQLKVANLESPTRIIPLAKKRFGMIEPTSVTYLSALPLKSYSKFARKP